MNKKHQKRIVNHGSSTSWFKKIVNLCNMVDDYHYFDDIRHTYTTIILLYTISYHIIYFISYCIILSYHIIHGKTNLYRYM